MLWLRYRDLFGIVWAKRVMDRVNQLLRRESLPMEITLDGIHIHSQNGPPTDAQLNRAIELYCWVLRRFADNEFLSQYFPAKLLPNESSRQNSGTSNP